MYKPASNVLSLKLFRHSNFTIMKGKISFPVTFEFKVMALSPQFSVRDSNGEEIAYVKQKLFKLKEDITVFENASQKNPLYKINANKWIDWSASYQLSENDGKPLGRMGRKGARSIWKATYDIFDNDGKPEFRVEEANAFAKIMDGLFSEVPILGLFTGYVFNPKYKVVDQSGNTVAMFTKEASFLGKKFRLDSTADLSEDEKERLILSLMMMVFLERRRG